MHVVPTSGRRRTREPAAMDADAHLTEPLVISPLGTHSSLYEGSSRSLGNIDVPIPIRSGNGLTRVRSEYRTLKPKAQRATRLDRRAKLRKPEPQIAGRREGRRPNARRAHRV